MAEKIFKTIEVTGTADSVEDATRFAITRAGQTVRNMCWFEVTSVRGRIKDQAVEEFQVTLKIGFELES